MLTTTRHTQLICAVDSYARATFTDILLSGDNWTSQVARLQKEFRAFIRVEACRYETLKADLNNWRERVTCGDAEFDQAREDEFKGALRALIDLESFLIETWDVYRARELILVKPRLVNLVRAHCQMAQKFLDTWKTPEWETANERTVEWNKEQTAYLRRKLARSE